MNNIVREFIVNHGFSPVKDDGKSGAFVCCRAHEDRSPSLHVTEGRNGDVVLHCFAGCSHDSVLASLGIVSVRRSAPEVHAPPSRGRSRIVETYDYTDEDGLVLYQVVRMEPKDFRQRRPNGAGGWTWTLGDVRRVLYRLPEIIESIALRKTIYVVEGEKDADRLWSLGQVATTNAGGAGKWRPEYSETLRGANVVIIPDNDSPGRAHAATVRASLLALETA